MKSAVWNNLFIIPDARLTGWAVKSCSEQRSKINAISINYL